MFPNWVSLTKKLPVLLVEFLASSEQITSQNPTGIQIDHCSKKTLLKKTMLTPLLNAD